MPSCFKCGKFFDRDGRYENHIIKCNPTGLHCQNCQKTFSQRCRYEIHIRSQHSCNECLQKFCSEIILERHIRTAHTGQGLVFDHDQDEAICPDSGHRETQEYLDFIRKHYNKIGSKVTDFPYRKIINKEIPASFSYKDLKKLLEQVRNQETGTFKINLGFGCVLYDVINKTYRYFYVSANHLIFERAYTISRYEDMEELYDKILRLDLADNYYMKRPSSSWVLVSLPNIEIQVFRLKGVPIGGAVILPDYIKNKRSIIGLNRDQSNGHLFTDNLCLFRCLAYHKKKTVKGLEILTVKLREEAERVTQKTFENGIAVNTLAEIETCFGISINVYELEENDIAKVIRRSTLGYKEVVNLNLYGDHFSYITNMKAYTKKFQCTLCSRILNRPNNLKDHIKTCNQEQSEIYRGGKFKNRKNLFQHLEGENIRINKELQGDPYVVCYDFESLQVPIEGTLLGRTLHYRHVPATVSICSNVPGFKDPIHLVSVPLRSVCSSVV